MNKVWSELNKIMQAQIKKKDTYEAGIATLFDLRNQLMECLTSFHKELSRKDFDAIPDVYKRQGLCRGVGIWVASYRRCWFGY